MQHSLVNYSIHSNDNSPAWKLQCTQKYVGLLSTMQGRRTVGSSIRSPFNQSGGRLGKCCQKAPASARSLSQNFVAISLCGGSSSLNLIFLAIARAKSHLIHALGPSSAAVNLSCRSVLCRIFSPSSSNSILDSATLCLRTVQLHSTHKCT